MKKSEIKNFKEFHSLVPTIIKQVIADQELAKRALVNPCLAFEELGYNISLEIQYEIEKYLRFSKQERKQIEDLEKEITKIAGKKINPGSLEELLPVLHKLKVSSSIINRLLKEKRIDSIEMSKLIIKNQKPGWRDPLKEAMKSIPELKGIIEYRKIINSKPPLGSKEMYEKLKKGETKLPISDIQITFHKNMKHHEEI